MLLSELGFDLLICIAEYLDAKDLTEFSSCCQALRPVGNHDPLWKRLCLADYRLAYNHPDQSYYGLYRRSKLRTHGRLPCHHLSSIRPQDPTASSSWHLPPCHSDATLETWTQKLSCCWRFFSGSLEQVFLCMHPDCHKLLCDRHARMHVRVCGQQDPRHGLFFKPNMAEIFCQFCVDWLGGLDSDPAEQYYVDQLTASWANSIYKDEFWRTTMLELRTRRRYERWLRWQDTPRRIVLNPRGFCFLSAQFMWEWERFVEGWRTYPPVVPANHCSAAPDTNHSDVREDTTSTASEPVARFNPFVPDSSDVLLVSRDTWDYLGHAYRIEAQSTLTEEFLLHADINKQWKHALLRYRDKFLTRH